MATDVIKMDYMTKRSIMKSRFRTENYKGRWFLLTSKCLSYYDGTPDNGKGKVKGQIFLRNVKVIEKVEPDYFNNKPNAFQVVYTDDSTGDLFTLYIMALTPEKRDEWIVQLRSTSEKCGAIFYEKYHPGLFSYRLGRWVCCEKIQKQAVGCTDVTWQPGTVSSCGLMSDKAEMNNNAKPTPAPSVSNATTNSMNRDRPVPPIPSVPDVRPPDKPKTMVMALYDYQKAEEEDLSLEKGEEYELLEQDQQFWWKAKDKNGQIGYIPANYVTKKEGDEFEQYDWYYPTISRAQSEVILNKESKDGCFVVRESSAKGMYTLSIFAREQGESVVKHYHIKRKGNDDYYLTERHAHDTIPNLINYHKHNCAGLIVRLRSSPASGRQNTAPTTPMIGHDKYEVDPSELQLLQDLGSGQFGTVKLAIWKDSKKVAVKMMKEDTMSEDDFIDEAKTMKELQHTNLVLLYGVCTKKKPIYIITEYMKHGSLLSYLRRHKTRLLKKPPTLLDMCFQVSQAMEYLETKQFIHRDLAARNCLVGENDICKVGDFGLARFVLDNEYTSSQGTKFPIRWAPPEVLSYTRFSTKSDVWSFGILMWEIFTGGDMPYGRVRNQDVVHQVCNQNKRLERSTRCPESAYDIMLKCWEDKPERRPDFCDIRTLLDDYLREFSDYVD